MKNIIPENLLTEQTSVYIKTNPGQVLFAHNEDALFRSASVIKLFIADFYFCNGYDMNEIIKISDDDFVSSSLLSEMKTKEISLYDCIAVMLAWSDNTATNVLINKAGYDRLNAFLHKRGFEKTVIGRLMMDWKAPELGRDNKTTAKEAVRVLSLLKDDERARDMLAMQKYRDGLMRYIFADVGFMGKSGGIPGVTNDTGMFFDKNGKLVYAAVLCDGAPEQTALQLCGRAGLAAYGTDYRLVVRE